MAVLAIVPFVKISTLYFPFISGKVYFFRLLVCIAFFFWVWLMIKDKQTGKSWREIFLPFKNIIVLGVLLFFLSQIIVSIFAVSPALAFFSTIERQDGVIQYGFWILYFLMLLSAFKDKQDWKILLSVFIIIAFLVSSYAWFNFKDQPRLHGIFGNPSYLAAYLIFAIGFCLILFKKKSFESKILNWTLLALSIFFAITIFYTQTRGVYLGLAVAVSLFCLLSILFLRQKNRKLAILCVIILAVGLISVSGLFLAKDTNFVKNNPMLSRVTEITDFWEIGSVRERILTWQIALKAFKEKPVFGYGPENFMIAFNKYYDYRIGKGDPWFDRAHNQFIEYLATGGVVMFSFYLFLLGATSFVIFKIFKKDKILSFILGSVFIAYIVQGVLLFDTLPVFLGLFPFLAYIVFEYRESNTQESNNLSRYNIKWQKPILVMAGLLSIFGIYATVAQPYKANAESIQFLAGTSQGYYEETMPFIKNAFAIKSPYMYWESRKRIGWQLLDTIDSDKTFKEEDKIKVSALYDLIVPEMEKFIEYRPFDPQMNYILSRTYRVGSEKLGKNDLLKAETLLNQAFNYSDLRIEYYNEMAQVLLAQDKFKEGEKLLKEYSERVKSFSYFPHLIMGHYYYLSRKYDLAIENYRQAKEQGYNFIENDGEYSRYIDSADKTKNYQELVDVSLQYIKERSPNADIYFNVALGYYYLGDRVKAKDFFQKALELDNKYEQYNNFFSRI